MDLEFRPATDDDWPEIWNVFHAVVAAGTTYPYSPSTTEDAGRRIWMARDHLVAVALTDGEIVGTAYFKANLPGLGDHVANAGWMIHPDFQGKGVGRRFAEYVIEEARRAGFQGMQFNAVVSTNAGAIALWESLGFEIVGTVPDAFRHPRDGQVPIHVMYAKL